MKGLSCSLFNKRPDFLFYPPDPTKMWGVAEIVHNEYVRRKTIQEIEKMRQLHKDDQQVRNCVLTQLSDRSRTIFDVLQAYEMCTKKQ
jgi:hypothetical protein